MKKYQKILAAFLAMCAFTSSAKAGSYQLNDYSVTGLGRAYAGVGVVGDDYSAIAFNPAGMSLKSTGMQVGVTAVNLHANVDRIKDGSYGRMHHWVPIPQAFFQYEINDRWDFGFGVYAPYGLATKYRDGWFGSNSAVESNLTIVDLSPALSYKVTDKFTVGAAFIARYIYGKMTSTLDGLVPSGGGYSEFELGGWTVTGTLGMLYEPVKDTRIGLSYRLRSTQQVKGDHTISGTTFMNGYFDEVATGKASPALPETVTLSLYQKVKKFGLSATARWTHWSQSFPEFVMKSDSKLMAAKNGEKRSVYNYDNSWSIALGTDYYYNDNWTFRFGVAYDEGAAHNDTARTYRIPDNDRYWVSAGLSYIQPNWQVDIGYSHLFVPASKVIGADLNGGNPTPNDEMDSGKIDMHSDIVGIQMQYHF